VSHIVKESSLITKEEVKEMIDDLDYVNAVFRDSVEYDIPNKL
jgi:hypothetical protein